MIGRLPSAFKVSSTSDLIRLGRNHDGGYLVSQSDVDKSDLLIGLGINDDWSFEQDFSKRNNVEIYAYDASISQKVFLKNFIKSLSRFDKPELAVHWLKVIRLYRKFFSEKHHHHIEKFVGLSSDNPAHITLAEVLNDIDHENIFLKIDIESSEYRLLETIITHQERIAGLVIEFHDCDIHLSRIEDFIQQLDLSIIHIHANNGPGVRSDGLPLVLEITFSSSDNLGPAPLLPHDLDMPNGKDRDEIHLIVEA